MFLFFEKDIFFLYPYIAFILGLLFTFSCILLDYIPFYFISFFHFLFFLLNLHLFFPFIGFYFGFSVVCIYKASRIEDSETIKLIENSVKLNIAHFLVTEHIISLLHPFSSKTSVLSSGRNGALLKYFVP